MKAIRESLVQFHEQTVVPGTALRGPERDRTGRALLAYHKQLGLCASGNDRSAGAVNVPRVQVVIQFALAEVLALAHGVIGSDDHVMPKFTLYTDIELVAPRYWILGREDLDRRFGDIDASNRIRSAGGRGGRKLRVDGADLSVVNLVELAQRHVS